MHVRNRIIGVVALALVIAALAPIGPAMATTTTVLPVKFTSNYKSFQPPVAFVTSGTVDATAVTTWVAGIAKQVNCNVANATLTLNKKKRRLDFKAAKTGFKLDQAASVNLICTTLASITPEATQTVTIALPTAITQPKITKFGKTVLVVKSRRKIYLYDNKKVVKTYRCAIGQPRYPTPSGTFHIGKKVKNPSWTNGWAPWSMHMPAYIGPGPNNPLGTRAMYVYTGATSGGHDTGVCFHGVPHSEDSSIGHAASHGCLRMHRKDVESFFPRVKVGTTVYIIN